jgi:hypothetical protein
VVVGDAPMRSKLTAPEERNSSPVPVNTSAPLSST